MGGDRCMICGNSRSKDKSVSLHRFPTNPAKRKAWIDALKLGEGDVKAHSRVCCRHFPNADSSKTPDLALGKRFASPKKSWTARAQRARKRSISQELAELSSRGKTSTPESSFVAAASASCSRDASVSEDDCPPMTVPIGEQLMTDYLVHEFQTDDIDLESVVSAQSSSNLSRSLNTSVNASSSVSQTDLNVIINSALIARIEALESENKCLKKSISTFSSKRCPFRVEDIAHDDRLIQFYTGFSSYDIFLAFYEFLGPAVDKLRYWGSKPGNRQRHKSTKLSPLNQLFLLLIKLKLNLLETDLAYRFSISTSLVSQYIITWVCFVYQHLQEVDWMPSVQQVAGTLPHAFREKYPTTFAIIDGSELFIETPSDLHLQSSTWSSYKHHNTAKFLVACTPNGAICFISPLYVGSISDVELTRCSGFIEKIDGKEGISIMADRGFTIKDQLEAIGVELNIPPFLDGRMQLSSEDVSKGRSIASLRIHVERAIGRLKTFRILKGTFPITMARLVNQVVSVCAWLTNFSPALVPVATDDDMEENSDTEVQDYFNDSEFEEEVATCDNENIMS